MTNPAAGAVNLGSAYGEVLIDYSNVEKNLQNVMATVERGVANSMNRVGANLQRMGAAVTVATLPIAGFVRQGVAAFANFEEVLAEIEARTGSTADQMKIIEATALEMGKKTAFSATEAANGMLQLLAAGMDTNQAIAALKPTLDLAAAGKIDLGTAAGAVTTILGQFNLEADQSARVADALARASAASRAEIIDLAQAFGNVGPIANRFGLSVEDTAAILAQFANNGIMGAEAGTQLKSMLTNMTRPTDEVNNMWKKLGISLYDAQGRIRPLNTVLQELNRRMKTMTEQERNEAITTLAGSYGQMGLEVLLASNGFDTMTASMEKQAGAAKVAGAWFGTLKGKMESMLGSLETVMLRIFKPLAENILKPLIDRGTEFLNWISDVLEKSPALAYGLGLVLAALTLLGPGLFAVGTGIRLLSLLMSTFSVGSMLAGLGPLLPILLAVAVAIGAVVTAYKTNFMGFATFVDRFTGDVGRIIETVQGFVRRIQDVGLGQALREFYSAGGRFQKTGRGVVRGILDIVGAVAGFIKLIREDGFIAAWQQVFTTLGDGSSWMGNILQSFGMAKGRAEDIGRVINRLAITFMNGVQAVRTFATGLISAFNSGGFRGAFDYLREAAIKALPMLLAGLTALFNGVWGWLTENAPGLAERFGEFAANAIQFLATKLVEYGPDIFVALASVWGAIQVWLLTVGVPEFVKFAVTTIAGFIEGFRDGFRDVNWGEVWTEVWNTAKKVAGVALALLWNGSMWIREKLVLPMINYLTNDVEWNEVWRDVWDGAKKAAGVALALLWNTSVWIREKLVLPMINYLKEVKWGEVWTDVWNGMKHAAGLTLALLWNFSQWLREKLYLPILNYIKGIDWMEIGNDLVQGFKDGVSNAWETLGVEGFFKDLWDKIPEWIRERLESHSPSMVMWSIGADIVAGLQNGINENAQGAINAAMAMAGQINGQVQGAMAQINALNALAARPVGMGASVGAMMTGSGGMGNSISNTNFGGINVVVPHNPNQNPYQQGQGVGRGVTAAIRRTGSGIRRG